MPLMNDIAHGESYHLNLNLKTKFNYSQKVYNVIILPKVSQVCVHRLRSQGNFPTPSHHDQSQYANIPKLVCLDAWNGPV